MFNETELYKMYHTKPEILIFLDKIKNCNDSEEEKVVHEVANEIADEIITHLETYYLEEGQAERYFDIVKYIAYDIIYKYNFEKKN